MGQSFREILKKATQGVGQPDANIPINQDTILPNPFRAFYRRVVPVSEFINIRQKASADVNVGEEFSMVQYNSADREKKDKDNKNYAHPFMPCNKKPDHD